VIEFGTRSLLLLVGTVHGLVLAALLLRARQNRIANRLLALLLVLVALRVVPYIIGFAGFYDVYPWLSYMPYDWSLAYGAVIWLYARVICTGALPPRWRWHLLPGAVQGLYYCVMFVQPLAFKNHWNETVHLPRIIPVETFWSLLAMCIYIALAWREHARYQRWLDSDLSNREEFRLTWLRGFLLALGITLLLWTGTVVVDTFVTQLNYFDRFPLYLWFSLLIYGLGVGGLRSADLAYPAPRATYEPLLAGAVGAYEPLPGTAGSIAESAMPQSVENAAAVSAAPIWMVGVETAEDIQAAEREEAERREEWQELGTRWSAQVRSAGWWRDPDLTAPLLARHLATNTTYLSRALNEGLGQNFNEFINRLRVEAVRAELSRPALDRDVLAVALDAGFNSKASFNRVFKRLTGSTPTDFRRQQGLGTSQLQ
jgi:AraC-like DNA-binding protein